MLTYIQILFFIGISGWCIKKSVCASYPSLYNEMGLAGDGDMAERGGNGKIRRIVVDDSRRWVLC